MKNIKVILISVLLLPGFIVVSFSQNDPDVLETVPVDENTGMIIYREVVQEPGTLDDFFKRAVNWINITYKSPSTVTSLRDPNSGIIEGNHRFVLETTTEEGIKVRGDMILYNFKLEFKEGRYRYTFTDFIHKQSSKFPLERWLDHNDLAYNASYPGKLRMINEYMINLISGLKDAMKPPKEIIEDEW